MKDSLAERLDQAIYYGILLSVFFVSIIFLPNIDDIFLLPKAVFLHLATVILIGLWLSKLLLAKNAVIKRSRFDLLVFAFFGIVAISTIFSVHRPTSIFGAYGQYEGLFTFISYFTVYFLAAQLDWDEGRLRTLLHWLVTGAALIAAYGLLQYFGLDFIQWPTNQFELNRSFSTFGNPSFLAGYLVFALPPAFSLYAMEKSNYRLVYVAAGLIIFSCIITTFTRGGWLAALVASVLFIRLGRKQLISRNSRAIIIIILLVALIIAAFALNPIQSNNPTTSFRARLVSAFNLNQTGIQMRFSFWKTGWKILESRPFFGSGPDTFGLMSAKYQDHYMAANPALPRNAHNYPIQLAATLGASGLFIFILIFVLVYLKGISLIRKPGGIMWAGIIAGITGYLFSVLFEVSVIQAVFILWLFFGVAAGFSRGSGRKEYWVSYEWKEPIRPRMRVLVLLLYLVPAVMILPVIINPLLADMHFLKGSRAQNSDEAAGEFKLATTYNPYATKYWLSRSNLYRQKFLGDHRLASMKTGIEILEQAKKYKNIEPKYYYFEGDILYLAFRRFKGDYNKRAISYFKQAITREPLMFAAHYFLAHAYANDGRYRQAKKELVVTKSINPAVALVWADLGYIYEKLGKPILAAKAYRQALKLKPGWRAVAQALERVSRMHDKR